MSGVLEMRRAITWCLEDALGRTVLWKKIILQWLLEMAGKAELLVLRRQLISRPVCQGVNCL